MVRKMVEILKFYSLLLQHFLLVHLLIVQVLKIVIVEPLADFMFFEIRFVCVRLYD